MRLKTRPQDTTTVFTPSQIEWARNRSIQSDSLAKEVIDVAAICDSHEVLRHELIERRAQEALGPHAPMCSIWLCGWEWKTENGSGVCRLTRDHELHYIGSVDSHQFKEQACTCARALPAGPRGAGE